MTTLPQADDPTLLSELTYDAWNRLVSVYDADSHSERTKNEYDGLHLRGWRSR